MKSRSFVKIFLFSLIILVFFNACSKKQQDNKILENQEGLKQVEQQDELKKLEQDFEEFKQLKRKQYEQSHKNKKEE